MFCHLLLFGRFYLSIKKGLGIALVILDLRIFAGLGTVYQLAVFELADVEIVLAGHFGDVQDGAPDSRLSGVVPAVGSKAHKNQIDKRDHDSNLRGRGSFCGSSCGCI
jgi:hypothetical protein